MLLQSVQLSIAKAIISSLHFLCTVTLTFLLLTSHRIPNLTSLLLSSISVWSTDYDWQVPQWSRYSIGLGNRLGLKQGKSPSPSAAKGKPLNISVLVSLPSKHQGGGAENGLNCETLFVTPVVLKIRSKIVTTSKTIFVVNETRRVQYHIQTLGLAWVFLAFNAWLLYQWL